MRGSVQQLHWPSGHLPSRTCALVHSLWLVPRFWMRFAILALAHACEVHFDERLPTRAGARMPVETRPLGFRAVKAWIPVGRGGSTKKQACRHNALAVGNLKIAPSTSGACLNSRGMYLILTTCGSRSVGGDTKRSKHLMVRGSTWSRGETCKSPGCLCPWCVEDLHLSWC